MPKNKKSIFAGGWNTDKAERLAKVEVPEKMRCSICKKIKATATYSKKQQLDLKNHVALGYDINHSGIRCRKCTGSQVHEMTCSICNEVKGLEGFSKAQRRTPDKARCIDCVNDHLNVHPNMKNAWDYSESSNDDDESVGDSYINSGDPEDDAATTSEVEGVSSSMNQLNFRNVETLAQVTGSEAANRPAAATFSSQAPRNGAVKNISAQDTGEILDGSVWRKWSEKNGQNARDGKPATEYTGWDSHGNAHQRIRAPSTALSDDYGTARTPAGSSKFARIKSDNRPFARPLRGPSPPPQVAPRLISGRQVTYSDSDTDSEWGVV